MKQSLPESGKQGEGDDVHASNSSHLKKPKSKKSGSRLETSSQKQVQTDLRDKDQAKMIDARVKDLNNSQVLKEQEVALGGTLGDQSLTEL